MFEWTSQGKLVPHIQLYDIQNFRDAFKAVADRKVIGKAVIQFSSAKL